VTDETFCSDTSPRFNLKCNLKPLHDSDHEAGPWRWRNGRQVVPPATLERLFSEQAELTWQQDLPVVYALTGVYTTSAILSGVYATEADAEAARARLIMSSQVAGLMLLSASISPALRVGVDLFLAPDQIGQPGVSGG